ncbi:2',3'-cyclic-nucleotide 3'-phosphodiesterase [Bombina bombina]|uniref:2',3'-cyclic-nucleotide 3'-phosphodiesterase n=1 Tax=Bombina bombina TaxID=8345 RepID=UPI00235AD289|nr:2',3'-cyclic-nucleotide 3'-phosphodiesterase [Bombina bombina]
MFVRLANFQLLFTAPRLLHAPSVLGCKSLGRSLTCCKVADTFKKTNLVSSIFSQRMMSSQAPVMQKLPFLVDDHTVSTVRDSKIMVLLRGLPGSGKTTLAKEIEQKYKDNSRFLSADDYNIKPAIRSSGGAEYKKLNEELTTCCERREASLLILDDTHHDRERLDELFDLANKYHFTVVVLESKTPWRLDCAQLKDRNHWNLSLEELKNLRPTLEKELIPLFFGWFVAKRDEDSLRKTSHEFLEQLGNLKAFKKRLSSFVSEDKHKLDLVKYFSTTPNILHCTTKFCDYGKVPGSEEYSQLEAVKKAYSKGFTLHISALFVTPRTAGARVDLTEEQLLLWPLDAEKEVMPKENLPRGSRAHLTLGTAGDVQNVQTGIDLLEFVKMQHSGSEGESIEELGLGKVSYYDNGMWMLTLSRKIEVKVIFSGYYGKPGAANTQRGSKKGILSQCHIM